MLLDVALFHSFSWLHNIPYSKRMRWLEGINDVTDMNLGKLQEILRDREAWSTVVQGFTKSWTLLGYWTKQQIFCCEIHIQTHTHAHTLHRLHHFICWRTLRLLPHLSYSKYCCSEHEHSFQISIFIFSWYMPKTGTPGSYGNSIVSVLKNLYAVEL